MLNKYLLLMLAMVGPVYGTTMEKLCLELTGPTVLTTGNTVGIEKGDTCFFVAAKDIDPSLKALIESSGGSPSDILICKSGKIFANPGQAQSASTGTPGHIMYKNYIGRMELPGKRDMPGAGKRIDFCNGACQRK